MEPVCGFCPTVVALSHLQGPSTQLVGAGCNLKHICWLTERAQNSTGWVGEAEVAYDQFLTSLLARGTPLDTPTHPLCQTSPTATETQ